MSGANLPRQLLKHLLQQVVMVQGKAKASKASKVLQPSTSQNQAGKSIEEVYQKKSQLEHILLRPDTYIGSTEAQQQKLWVHDGEQLVLKDVDFVPGLYKIFDEILVNAADNKIRDPKMDTVRVDIDPVSLLKCCSPSTCASIVQLRHIMPTRSASFSDWKSSVIRWQTASECGTMVMEYQWRYTRKKRCMCQSLSSAIY